MMRPRAILFLLVLAGLVVAFAPLPVQTNTLVARTFQIKASQFAYSPAEIAVNAGDTVTIELISTDVVHGLYVDGYDLSVKADPGQTAMLSFVADKPGSFRLRCNVTCGAMHPFMIGKLNVGANTWLYRSIALAFIDIFSIFILARRKSGKIQAQ
jgi:heme/copper-type cytochrome/quinol oxidase subunit 2